MSVIPRQTLGYVFLSVLAMFLLLQGCGVSDGISLAADVNPRGWRSDKHYELKYNNSDTTSLKEISVFMRHNREFALRNDSLVLEVKTFTPDSLTYREYWTFLPVIEDSDSKVTSIETRQIYRTNVMFAKEGEYVFTLSHNNPRRLQGVRSIGIEITDVRSE